MIAWHAFSWDAFATITGSVATLATGIGAVVAAYRIGKRQVAISERQADITAEQTAIQDRQASILERQTKLQELTLASELYDRRMTVYRATTALIGEAMQLTTPYSNAVFHDYLAAMAAVGFLFEKSVKDYMWRVLQTTVRLQTVSGNVETVSEGVEKEKAIETQVKLLTQIADLQTRLPTVFKELRLSVDEKL